MRWEDERYVRVYTRDTVDWQGLSFDAQALFVLLLRKVDRAGLLDLGKPGKRGVAVAVGHPREWARLEPALEELLTDGCVQVVDSGRRLLVPNFLAAQEAKASDKSRQQKSRETARDSAVLQDVMSRDAVSHGVTVGHETGQNVTSGHAASRPVTPSRAVPSLAVPSSLPTASAIGGETEALPDATEDAVALDGEPKRETLVLTAQTAGRKEPKPSEAQKLYAALEASRADRCEKAGFQLVAQGWDARRINATLGPVVKVRKGEALNAEGKTEAQQRFEDAWNEYLADDEGATREPPWAIGWFMSGGVRARYETRAIRAQQGAA